MISGLKTQINALDQPTQQRRFLEEEEPVPEWRQNVTLDASYGMVWLDIEKNPSRGCGWGTNYASNCQYVRELV